MNKPKVAFVCIHNSFRSQIVEAFVKSLASDLFDSYSAGTEIKLRINEDAICIMKNLYSIDMEHTQCSKLLKDIPQVDIVVTMVYNVQCHFLPCKICETGNLLSKRKRRCGISENKL